MRTLPKIIHVHNARELHEITETADTLSIGAAATYAEAEEAMRKLDPDVGEALRRLGSTQVRASGTVGGNIANGSPIGDTPPMLIALGADLVLRHGDSERSLPLEDFFIAYGKQDRKPGELVWRVDVPKLKSGEAFRAYKISKRFDQDISAVMAGFEFALAGRRVSSARLAFGGLAATPKRAANAEAALAGASLGDEKSWEAAIAALARDFAPISDMRASASYRLDVAQALLRKALIELSVSSSAETRVIGLRERAA